MQKQQSTSALPLMIGRESGKGRLACTYIAFSFSLALFSFLFIFFISPAHAQCANPNGVAGEMVYNEDHCVMQVCDGTNWLAAGTVLENCTVADLCAGTPSIGDTCADGSVFVGLLNVDGVPGDEQIFIPAADQSSGTSWNNGTSDHTITGATSLTDGLANTTTLTTAPVNADAGAPYQAAELCAALTDHGQAAGTWYLPSQDELDLIYDNLVDQNGDNTPGGPLGDPAALYGFDTSGVFLAGFYWSSSEKGSFPAWIQSFSDGSSGGLSKGNALSVRCARRN